MPPRFVARKAQPKVAAVMETAEVCFRGLPPQLSDSQLMQFLRPKIGVNAIGVSRRSPKGEVFLRVPDPAVASVIQALDGLKEIDGTQLPVPLRVTRADGPDVSFGSPTARENKSSTPCTFWQKGHCPRGEDCRFSHSGERPVCFMFQKGTCPHGASCRFSHDAPATSTTGLDRASVLGPCFAFQKGNCPNGVNCRFAHDTTNDNKMPSTPKTHHPCHLFQKGSCPHGVDCRFSHAANFSSPGFEHKKSDTARPCLNFVNGKCTNGENCIYSHDPQVTGGPRPCFNFQKGLCTRGADCGYSHSRDMACFAFNKGNCARGANCEFAHEAVGPRPCFNFQRGMCTRGEDCIYAHDTKKHFNLSKEVEYEIKRLARKLLNTICDGKLYAHLPETAAEEFHMKQESEDMVRRQLEMHKQRMKNMQFDSLLPLPQEGPEFRRLGFTKTTTLPAITMDSKRGFVTHEFKGGNRDAPFFKMEGPSSGRKDQGHFGDTSDDKDHWGANGYRDKESGRAGGLSRPNERNDSDQSRNPYVTGSNTYQDDKREENSFREKRPRTEDMDNNSYRQRDDRERDYHDSYDKRPRDDMDNYRHRDLESDKRVKTEDPNPYRTRDDYEKRSRNDDINNAYRSNDRESDRRSKSHDIENNPYRVHERDDKRRDTNVDNSCRHSSRDETRESDSAKRLSNDNNPYFPPPKTSETVTKPPPPSEPDAPPGMSRAIPAPSPPLRSVADVSHLLLTAEDNMHRGSDSFEAVSQVASSLSLSDRPGTVNQVAELLARGEVTTVILDRFLKVLERMDSRSRPVEVRASDGSIDHVRVDVLTKILQDALRSFKQKKLISLTSNLKTSSAGSQSERSSRKRSLSPSSRKRSSSPSHSKRSPSPTSRKRSSSDRRSKRSVSPSERRDRHRDRSGHKKEKRDREKPSRSSEKRRRSRSRSHSRSRSSS